MSEDFEEMATWLLDCKYCSEAFTYSLVPDTLFPSRASIPTGRSGTQVPQLQNQVYLPAS